VLAICQHHLDKQATPSIKFTQARKLQLESFNLGDARAAKFHYIISPIQAAYNSAIQTLKDASYGVKVSKRGILVLGESNAGKTRLALETMMKTLPKWPVLRWRPDYTIEKAPIAEATSKKRLIIFIDDIQNYVATQLTSDLRSATLRTLIETLLQDVQYVIIVATCRLEDEVRVQAQLNWLLDRLTIIKVPSFNANKSDLQSSQIITEFQRQGPVQTDDWDGTLGSLVLGLSTKNSQYLAVVEADAPAAIVLRAMKLLTEAGTINHTEQRVRAVCAGVFGEREIQENEKTWRTTVNHLISLQFITVDDDALEEALVIRKDTYFEKVVTDYQPSHRDLIRLCSLLVELKDIDALSDLGFTLMRLGRYEEAVAAYDQALAFDPNKAVTWTNKAVAHGLLEQYKEELQAAEQAVAIDPTLAAAWADKAVALKELGQPEEALAAYDQALTLNPTLAAAWDDKGKAHWLLDQYKEALSAFNQAVKYAPQNAAFWRTKGKAHSALGQYEEALVAFTQVLILDPMDASAWKEEGNTLENLGNYKDAVDAFNQALILDPKLTDVWPNIGASLVEVGNYGEALDTLDRALTLDPKNAYVWSNKGAALAALGHYKEALDAFNRMLTLDPKLTAAWINKGNVLAKLGSYNDALDAYEAVLTLDPKNAVAWRNKGYALGALRHYEEALDALDEALAIDPNLSDAQSSRVSILRVLGRE
jgi:tetratricopeptide (TPR) repeat protein